MIPTSAVSLPCVAGSMRPAWPADRALLSDEEWQALLWPLPESLPQTAGSGVSAHANGVSAQGDAS